MDGLLVAAEMKPLLVVTGTRREGALVAGPGVTVLAGGGNSVRLAEDLARLAPHACGIISFGTGGGLGPGLRLGEMVIGNALIGMLKRPALNLDHLNPPPLGEVAARRADGGGAFSDIAQTPSVSLRETPPPKGEDFTSHIRRGALNRDCDAAWVQSLARALPQARIGAVFANGTLLSTPTTKSRAGAGGAVIVDMESHLAGAAAAQHGLPFAILRCISDLADATLPPAVAVAMRPDGGLAIGAVLGSILRRPEQLPALIRTGADFGRAFAALQTGVRAVGPRLGFDERQNAGGTL